MKNNQIPQAAWQRFLQLENEERDVKSAIEDQFGTSIPKLFYQASSYVSNPSAVGTAVLARMIETDDAVSSSIQFKILMILSKIGDYHHENAEINDFVNGFLKRLKAPTWAETLEGMLSAKGYGFSVSEVCYGIDDQMRKIPVRIPTYHPNTVAFECDEYGQITDMGVIQFVLQHTQFTNPNSRLYGIQYGNRVNNPFTTPTDRLSPYRIPFLYNYGMVRIPRKKVIHMTNLPMFSFGSPYGKTEVRTAHLAWQLKQFLMRQLGVCAKRNANGFIWATAPRGGQSVEVNMPDGSVIKKSPVKALTDLLASRENDDAVVTGQESEGYKLTGLPQTGNMDQYLSALNNLDVRIFRCFLLPDLVMTSGESGSRALGEKHWEVVDKMAENEAMKFCHSIINDMIEPTIIDNFGPQKEGYGEFKKRAQSAEEMQTLANTFSTLTTSGIMKNHVAADMDYMRQTLGLPKDTDTSFDIAGDGGEVQDPSNPTDPNAQKEGAEETGDESHGNPHIGADTNAQNGNSVQDSILNGAQVSSLVTIVQAVAAKELPEASAIQIMMMAFNITEEQARKILADAATFVKDDGGEVAPEDDPKNSPKDKSEGDSNAKT